MQIDEQSESSPDPTPKTTDASSSRWRQLGRTASSAAALILAVLLGVLIGRAGSDDVEDPAVEAGEHDDHPTVWTCAMHPQIRMEAPGQCPICGMDLVPAGNNADEEHGPTPPKVTLSPAARALAGIRTSSVVRTEPRAEVRLLGRVDYDETRMRMVTPWTDGRIDRLQVRVTGTRVRKGQVVAQLYSPEVYAAMRDLVLAAKQAGKLSRGMHGSAGLAAAAVNSAREKLRLLGVSEAEIKSIEKTRNAPQYVSIRSAFSGTILKRNVEEGDYVKAGTPLYHVADLSRVWVQIDAYESDLPHLSVGQTVLVEIESLPGETFVGKVAFIDPVIDKKTRTARVRVEVTNQDGQLRPGMFAQAVIEADIGDKSSHLVIPATAPLFTGRRSVVYVAVPGEAGSYELREVRLGARAGPVYPVLAGLSEGEEVVSHGAFALDADLQLGGGRSMMTLADDHEEGGGPNVPITPEVLAALEPVFAAYLRAQKQLAADDFDGARASLKSLAGATNDVQLPGARSTREDWQGFASKLAGHGQHASMADAEGEVRTAFEHLSMQLIGLLRTFGNPTEGSLRVAFCPMAFDNRGAQWVQDQQDVENPYYGAAMLRCGEFKVTVLPGERLASPLTEDAPPPSAATAGHNH
jgi:Cu(I)/Ag(I) efflux system membrane fusion protein